MYSIGIDHKRYSQIPIIQENGKIINRHKVNNDRKSIKRALSPYAQYGSKAVLESGWNWGPLYNMVSDRDLEVKVSHSLKVKAKAEAKIKTDKISSADFLAHLLRADLIPECYIRGNSSRRIQHKYLR